jgi:hypothetical protein
MEINADAANRAINYTVNSGDATAKHIWNLGDAGTLSGAMLLNSTGLGIGTSSPTEKLDVNGAITMSASATTKLSWSNPGAYLNWIECGGVAGNNYMRFATGNQEAMRINNAGNLGLGVPPSAWSTTNSTKVFQISNRGSIWGNSNSNSINNNWYLASGDVDRYIETGRALRYNQSTLGIHEWFTAPSGTAGDAISFTQAMTLDASGNLLVGGTTTPSGKSNNFVNLGGSGGFWTKSGGVGYFGTFDNYAMVFATNDTERARIDSSGNLLVGTTSVANTSKITFGFNPNVENGLSINDIDGTQNSIGYINFSRSGTSKGSITYNNSLGLVAYNTTSDYRAKDISGPLTNSGALIDSVPVYMGKMKWAEQERPMFIAHETPAYAHTGEKDAVDADGNPVYQQMDASALIPVMWAEIQSLRQRLSAANL